MRRPLAVSALALLYACGGGADSPPPPACPTAVAEYDESLAGPLPYGLAGLPETDLAKFTFGLSAGTFVVRGTSASGERFRICVSDGSYLKSITVKFSTRIDNNDHVLFLLPEPFAAAVLTKVVPMPLVGQYEYAVEFADRSIGPGRYEVYSGTSVTGSSVENPFTLTFIAAR